MAAPNQSPAKCEVLSVIRFLNAKGERPAEIHEQIVLFAGLWIGAAISNTSHSNKAGSTTVKRTGLTGKGSRSTAVLPQ
jgi:hypothetical protein